MSSDDDDFLTAMSSDDDDFLSAPPVGFLESLNASASSVSDRTDDDALSGLGTQGRAAEQFLSEAPSAAATPPPTQDAAVVGVPDASFGTNLMALLDKEADGVVSEHELREGIASGTLSAVLGPPEQAQQTARLVFSGFDADSNDVLNATELTEMAQRALGLQREADHRKAQSADEHLTASLQEGQGAGMYRCLQDAGVTDDLELGATPTLLRMYTAGTCFYVNQVAMTGDGRARALAAEGGWVSLVSNSGRRLLEPTGPLGYFRCVGPAALVTASLNGTGRGLDGLRRLDHGDEVLAVGEAVSLNGARRLRLEDGWVSVVNTKGVVLMVAVHEVSAAISTTSRASEDSLLREAQEFVASSSYTDMHGAAAAQIQARVRGNDARKAFEAKRDALQRELGDPRMSESVACVNKLWHQLCDGARQAASTLGWTASTWDQGICPVKYWKSLGADERRAALFMGFTQITWDTLGVEEGDAAGVTSPRDTSKPPSVAACIEALCMLDPSFRQKLPADAATLNIGYVNDLLGDVSRGNGSLAAESTELLKLLRIALGGTEPSDEASDAKLPIHHRLYKQHLKHPRNKKRPERPRALGTPTPAIVRKPLMTPKDPAPLPRDNPFASPATSRGYRTIYPDVTDIVHHHPLAGMGTTTALKGMARNHIEMEQPEQPSRSADHEKMLTPWKNMKVKREPLRHVAAQKDREQARRRRDALNCRVNSNDRVVVEGPGMFGTAPRCRGKVAHTANVREKPGRAIEGHARSGQQYIVDETRRENAEQLLQGLKKLKGLDRRPWKADDDEMAKLSKAERQRRFAIAEILDQLLSGRCQVYWKMIRDAKNAFATIDEDASGTLDSAEFAQALSCLELGASGKQATRLFEAMDVDNNGSISCHEFLTYFARAAERAQPQTRPANDGVSESKVTGTVDKGHEASVCNQLYSQALESPVPVFCDARVLVTELLDHGANGMLRSKYGETALCKAVAGNAWPFARDLITRMGSSELLLLAAHQRLAWARVLTEWGAVWASRKKLAARITKFLEMIVEPSQAMTVGSAQTLTTLALTALPDWVAELYGERPGLDDSASTCVTESTDSSHSTPRYMRTTANLERRYCKDPWRATEDRKGGLDHSEGSSTGDLLRHRHDGGQQTRNADALKAARELAIRLHHPTPESSTERARRIAQQQPAAFPDAESGEGSDAPVASPHQRSLEDYWSVYGKQHHAVRAVEVSRSQPTR